MTEYEKWRVFLNAVQVVATIISPCITFYILNKYRK